MRRLGSVQQKIPCVFMTEVTDERSIKRESQQFRVLATNTVNPVALDSNVECALATEKLDGTCCYVTVYKGQPHLWARLDRKPNKQADKRLKQYQHSHKTCKGFTWDVEKDFKTLPDAWIPAHKVQHLDGQPVPDEHGHIPGWVPVEKDNKQYIWHSSVVDHDAGLALVLRVGAESEDQLEIATIPLADLLEQTLELIGTNVNGNPYGMGSKKQPVHVLVAHGSMRFRNPPPVDYQQLCSWFQNSPEGGVEGIVWHCNNGTLVKLHRHHLGLRWPDGDPFLNRRPVVVNVEGAVDEAVDESDIARKDLFTALRKMNGLCFKRLQDIQIDS